MKPLSMVRGKLAVSLARYQLTSAPHILARAQVRCEICLIFFSLFHRFTLPMRDDNLEVKDKMVSVTYVLT